MYLDRARAIFQAEHARLGTGFLSALRGCPPEEIDALAEALGLELPAVYREFLLWMGRQALTLFENARTQCREVPAMREELQALLDEQGLGELPDDAIVFYSYNGYHYRWMRVSQGDDPPVYEYISGEPIVRQTYDRFSALIESRLRDFATQLVKGTA